jgi:hypothetical protein
MKKCAIVINGRGGVGKDTLCELAAKHFKVYNISSVDPIKEIARFCGWDGGKTDRDRKFLSDLKHVLVEYNDYPTAWATEEYKRFLAGDEQIMFVHIREAEEIAKFVKATDGTAKTLLVRGGSRMTKSTYGNASDDLVEGYAYDYYYVNEKTLDIAEVEFVEVLKNIINQA